MSPTPSGVEFGEEVREERGERGKVHKDGDDRRDGDGFEEH